MSVKKITIGLSATALIAGLAIGPALASAKIVKRNERTGASSLNINRNDMTSRLRDEHRNRADIFNKADIFENTGGNDTEMNTTAGDIDTGNATTNVILTNEVNQGDDEELLAPEPEETDVTETNMITGADSTNKNILNLRVKRTYERINQADLHNKLYVDGITGDNDMLKNTEGGSITTGNAGTTIDILNIVN